MTAKLFRILLVPSAGLIIAGALAIKPQAAELSAAERLYAELAALAPAERQARLEEGARHEGKLVFVHTRRNNLYEAHVALFTRRYPFVAVDTTSIGSQDAAERLVAEETAGAHPTDLMSLSVPDLEEVLARNFAARYPTPATGAVLPRYRGFIDPQGRWTPFYVSDFGITYNPNMVPLGQAPKTWFDLCDPRFKGSVSFDGSQHPVPGRHLRHDGRREDQGVARMYRQEQSDRGADHHHPVPAHAGRRSCGAGAELHLLLPCREGAESRDAVRGGALRSADRIGRRDGDQP